MAISTNGTVLARLAGGLYNQTLSNATYNEVVAVVKSAADINTLANDLYARDFAGKSDLAVATTLVSNLGLSSIAGLNNWVSAQLTAAGASGKGAKIISLLNDLSNLTSDATYGSYATAFNAKTDAALALSQTAASKGGDFAAAATLAAAEAAAKVAADAAAAAAAAQAAADKVVADAAAAAAAAEAAAKAAADKVVADAAAKAAADKVIADAEAAALVPKLLTLTTGTDKGTAFTGGNGDDQFDGFQSTASTYQAGDVLDGGAGNDTLTIILRADPDDVATVTLKNIETVNASIQATDATGGQLDAASWTGVATLSNAGSTAGSLLSVSGLALTTTVYASGNTDVTLDYRGDLTGSADTVSVQLAKFGTGTAQTLSGTGEVILAAGVDAVNVSLAGTSFVSIDGDDIKTITLTGTGAATVLTNDAITRFDASALVGTNAFTFSGSATTLMATGGAGNDTFTFITGGLSNADVIEGGSGIDTIRATLAGGTSAPALTGFETGRFLFTTTVNNKLDLASNTQGWNGITVSGSAAGTDVELMNVYAAASGLTLTLDDSTLSDLTLDSVTGSSVTINVGSGTGAVGIGSLEISDVTTLAIKSVSTAAETISLVADSNAQTKSLTISNGASGSLTVSDITVSAVQTVVLGTSGSGGLTVSDGFRNATAITSLTINAEGSDAADVILSADLFSGSAAASLDTITITANSGGDVLLNSGTLALSTDGTAAEASAGIKNAIAVIITAGTDSVVGASAGTNSFAISAAGVDLTLNLTANDNGVIRIGDITSNGTGVGSVVINATVGTAGSIAVDDYSGSGLNYTVSTAVVGVSGALALGDAEVTGGAVSYGTITLATGASATLGAVIGASSVGAMTINAASHADFTMGDVPSTTKIGALTATLGTAASATFGAFAAATSAGPIAITLASGAFLDANVAGEFYSAGKSISSITVGVGTGASANVGIINASSIGSVDVSLASAGTAEFVSIAGSGTVASGGSIGSLNFSGAGFVLVTDVHASSGGTIGSLNLTMTTASTATFTTFGTAENTIDTITINVATGASATFTKIEATALNTVTIAGAGNVTLAVSGTTFRTADFIGASGTVTADLTGVINAVVVNAGHGTTVILSGSGNDTINLLSGSGTDTIRLATATQGTDTIVNFTTADKIELSTGFIGASGGIINGSAIATDATTVGITLATTASGAITIAAGTQVVLINATAFASTARMVSAIGTGGSLEIGMSDASTAGSLVVVWTDGSGSYVSVVGVIAASGVAAIVDGASAMATLAYLQGVTPGALVAANFDLV